MKNPWMSMWLSGANAFWGAARGQAAAAGKRQAASFMEEGAKQVMKSMGAIPLSQVKRPRRTGTRSKRK
jgi:hypothetical protein